MKQSLSPPTFKPMGLKMSYILNIFIMAALILSALLICKHSGICKGSMGCSIDGVDGCAELANSGYSEIFGIQIAKIGFSYYALLLSIGLALLWSNKVWHRKISLLVSLTVIGFIFDLFLAYRNYFVLITPCRLCSLTYLCQFGILVSSLWIYFSPDLLRQGKIQEGSQTKGFLPILKELGRALWPSALLSLALIILMAVTITLFSPPKDKGEGHDHSSHDSHSHDSSSSMDPLRISLLPKANVSSMLRELNSLSKTPVSAQGMIAGEQNSTSAYIIVHKWLDFGCPHCYKGTQLLDEANERWPGRIRTYYRHFPLDGNCNPAVERKREQPSTCWGAQAAICTEGKPYFLDFFHKIYELQNTRTPISPQVLEEIAKKTGADWNQVKNCMSSASTASRLKRDIRDAIQIKINATPSFVVNDHKIPGGAPPREWFFKVLDALVLDQEGDRAIKDLIRRRTKRE